MTWGWDGIEIYFSHTIIYPAAFIENIILFPLLCGNYFMVNQVSIDQFLSSSVPTFGLYFLIPGSIPLWLYYYNFVICINIQIANSLTLFFFPWLSGGPGFMLNRRESLLADPSPFLSALLSPHYKEILNLWLGAEALEYLPLAWPWRELTGTAHLLLQV